MYIREKEKEMDELRLKGWMDGLFFLNMTIHILDIHSKNIWNKNTLYSTLSFLNIYM